MIERIFILENQVHNVSMNQAVDYIVEGLIHSGPHQIVTFNAEMAMLAESNAEFKRVASKASLVVPDGAGIILAGKLQGQPLKEKVPGIELMENLIRTASQKDLRIYFLGGAPGVAMKAKEILQKRYPTVQIVGVRDGYFKADEEKEIVEEIKNLKPHFLFVALGVPRQEFWIRDNKEKLGVPIMMGVGGSFDVISGTKKRAPKLMQKLWLEWLYRLYQEPHRIGRMMALPNFVVAVMLNKLKK